MCQWCFDVDDPVRDKSCLERAAKPKQNIASKSDGLALQLSSAITTDMQMNSTDILHHTRTPN